MPRRPPSESRTPARGPRRPKSPSSSPKRAERSTPTPRLRTRLWVEVAGKAALTDAGADLLEQIGLCGSLSEAARRLGFSYRRAWMLVDAMNTRWPRPLVMGAAGGPRGGGSRLTPGGGRVLAAYRDLQARAEFFLDTAAAEFLAALGSPRD